MPACESCGSYVSHDFVRVCGLNSAVHACPSCGRTWGNDEAALERAGIAPGGGR